MEAELKVYIHLGMAFVELLPNYLVCIGTEEEVRQATQAHLARLVCEAIAKLQWNSISDSSSHVCH